MPASKGAELERLCQMTSIAVGIIVLDDKSLRGIGGLDLQN